MRRTVTDVGVVRPASASTFSAQVLESRLPVLVDFWAPWCGPCRMIGPIVEDIAAECAGSLAVAKVNIDENPEIAEAYGVMSVPTLMVFVAGQPVRTVAGSKPKAALLRELAEFV